MTVIIRQIKAADAAAFVHLCQQLDAETKFMLLEPGERTLSAADQESRIDNVLAHDNQTMFVVEDTAAGALVGYLGAWGGSVARNRATAYIVIGVRQTYAGQGIGTRLFEALDGWARRAGIHRLELTVMTHNAAGVALYQKMGFAIEGTRHHALCVDGAFVDEYYMGKVLA